MQVTIFYQVSQISGHCIIDQGNYQSTTIEVNLDKFDHVVAEDCAIDWFNSQPMRKGQVIRVVHSQPLDVECGYCRRLNDPMVEVQPGEWIHEHCLEELTILEATGAMWGKTF